MRTFWTLWRREMAAYYLSPIAYVVTIFFLVILGFSFWMLASILAQGSTNVAIMRELFGSIFFWLALLVTVPMLTMRLIAEEKRSGALESLLTAPVTDAEVILAKYAGAFMFFVAMWIPTAAYGFILKAYSPLAAPIDLGPMFSGYLGAALVGAFYLSIGLFCSAVTRNQIIAAIMCFALIGIAFFAGFLPYISLNPRMREWGEYFSSVSHMLNFSRGIVDTRPICFYLTGTMFMLFASIRALDSRNWK